MPEIAFHKLSVADGTPQIYNGGDVLMTAEIWEKLNNLPHPRLIYNLERSMQAMAMEMMLRGFRVDPLAREDGISGIRRKLESLDNFLCELSQAVLNKDVNYDSGPQLKELFYDFFRIPPIKKWHKGELKEPMDGATLEKLLEFPLARPFARLVLSCRELDKTLETLEMEVDDDWRMRTSINIAGTREARWSTSASFLGTGGNLQNITQDLRHMFIADEGWKLCGIDKEQAESRWVGFLCGIFFDDWSYLDACECLTREHDVLTPTGWISIADKPEKILVWDNGDTYFDDVSRWNEGIAASLISVENRNISVVGTVNHTMPVFTGHYANRLEKRTLADIYLKPNYTAPLTGKLIRGGQREPLAELLAAFQADGTKDPQGKVHWTFRKQRKIEAMRRILKKHNLRYSEYNLGNGNTRFYLHARQGQEKWNKECGPEILNWDTGTIAEFCQSHYIWDASTTEENISIVNISQSHIMWLSTAYMLYGKSTTIKPHKSNYWELTIKNNLNTQYRSCKINKIELDTPVPVFCPTIPSGYFVCRRNNKIFISGNSGDLHTTVARAWVTEISWTGDLKQDRILADKPFGDDTYRQASKILNHATVIMGKPITIAAHTKIPAKTVEKFQQGFFSEFPCIPRLHTWIAGKIQRTGFLTNPFGRRRDFFGRPDDDATIRQGMAFMQASPNADDINLGINRMWTKMGSRIQILTQEHDAVYFQFKETDDEKEIVSEAQKHLKIEFDLGFRKFSVPTEAKTGWNKGPRWKQNSEGKWIESNPRGLDKPGAKRNQ